MFDLTEGILPDARYQAMLDLEALFAKSAFSGHHTQMVSAVSGTPYRVEADTVEEFEYIYHKTATDILLEMGVVLSDDADIILTSEVLIGLQALEDPENSDILIEVFESEVSDPEATLALLLSEVTEYSFLTLVGKITSANEDSVLALKTLVSDEEVRVESEKVAGIRTSLKKAIAIMPDSKVIEQVKNIADLPINLNMSADLLQQHIEDLPDDVIGKELAILNIAAGVGLDKLKDHTYTLIEEYVQPMFVERAYRGALSFISAMGDSNA